MRYAVYMTRVQKKPALKSSTKKLKKGAVDLKAYKEKIMKFPPFLSEQDAIDIANLRKNLDRSPWDEA